MSDVSKLKEQIAHDYHCSDSHGESCSGDCDECKMQLLDELNEFEEEVKAIAIKQIEFDVKAHHCQEEWNNGYQQGKLDAYKNRENADGCKGCAFETSCESWELPCAKCKRNCKDYWRGEAE